MVVWVVVKSGVSVYASFNTEKHIQLPKRRTSLYLIYVGDSISKLQIQVAT
jgi:hypothetical protein